MGYGAPTRVPGTSTKQTTYSVASQVWLPSAQACRVGLVVRVAVGLSVGLAVGEALGLEAVGEDVGGGACVFYSSSSPWRTQHENRGMMLFG